MSARMAAGISRMAAGTSGPQPTHPEPTRPPRTSASDLPGYAGTPEDAAAIRAHIAHMVAAWPPLSAALKSRLRPLVIKA